MTRRIVGSDRVGLWQYSLLPDAAADLAISRTSIVAATPIIELSQAMSADIVRRAARGNRLSVLGRAFDIGAPVVAPALTAYGVAEASKPMKVSGIVVAGLGLVRAVMRGAAPDPERYLEELLPERVSCAAGVCGTFFVVTGIVPGARRMAFHVDAGNAVTPVDVGDWGRTLTIMEAR